MAQSIVLSGNQRYQASPPPPNVYVINTGSQPAPQQYPTFQPQYPQPQYPQPQYPPQQAPPPPQQASNDASKYQTNVIKEKEKGKKSGGCCQCMKGACCCTAACIGALACCGCLAALFGADIGEFAENLGEGVVNVAEDVGEGVGNLG
eukprot:GHVS01010112.1.p1 GENE.GHVS01010112.1~~GHVS01010112.1.p1  ORF type:complete len:160 (+),score=24.97 GHVS01010112.1:39-482(+)